MFAFSHHRDVARLSGVHRCLSTGMDKDAGVDSNQHAHGHVHFHALFSKSFRRVGARNGDAPKAACVGVPVSTADGSGGAVSSQTRHEKTAPLRGGDGAISNR